MMKEPKIAQGVKVFEGAKVVGEVAIGEGSAIWYNAVLRGDMEPIIVGRNTNIQDLAVLHGGDGHGVTVGDGVSVGHSAILHGCKVGNNTMVGMGSILMNGSEIGEGSLVAAGSLVTQGSKFEPGMLIVGRPAKAVRPVNEQEKAYMQWVAQDYVRLAQQDAESEAT